MISGARRQNIPSPAAITHTPSPDFAASDPNKLVTGMKVEHPKFGFGKVIGMDTDGANRKATILFDKHGEKTLLLSFAKIRIVE